MRSDTHIYFFLVLPWAAGVAGLGLPEVAPSPRRGQDKGPVMDGGLLTQGTSFKGLSQQ